MKREIAPLTLTKKEIDGLNGFSESMIQENHTIVVLPIGERQHVWDSNGKMVGAALMAIDMTDDTTPSIGWISLKGLIGGLAYIEQPKKVIWELSKDKQWWICKDAAETEQASFGISKILKGLVDGSVLRGPIKITFSKVIKMWTAAPVKSSSSKPRSNGFDKTMKYWEGNAEWLSEDDRTNLKAYFEGESIVEAIQPLPYLQSSN